MTKDMLELYIWVLKKGYHPRIKQKNAIELVNDNGVRHNITLVNNDFLKALKYDKGAISSDATPFFQRLRHVWDKDVKKERKCEDASPEGYVPVSGKSNDNS